MAPWARAGRPPPAKSRKARENVDSDGTSEADSQPHSLRGTAAERRRPTSAAVVWTFHTALARNAKARGRRPCGLRPLPRYLYGPMCRASPEASAALTNSASLAERGPRPSSMHGTGLCVILSHRPESARTMCLLEFSQTQDSAAPAPCPAPFSVMGGGFARGSVFSYQKEFRFHATFGKN
jgi:hypothetical protein